MEYNGIHNCKIERAINAVALSDAWASYLLCGDSVDNSYLWLAAHAYNILIT